MARLTSNTTKEYPCPMCGELGNIVREGHDPRVKCNNTSCNFLYSGSDSMAAKEAGEIPSEPRIKPEKEIAPSRETNPRRTAKIAAKTATIAPRNPKYLLLAKDRKECNYATDKNLEEKVVEWMAVKKKFDLFELMPKQVDTKVEIN